MAKIFWKESEYEAVGRELYRRLLPITGGNVFTAQEVLPSDRRKSRSSCYMIVHDKREKFENYRLLEKTKQEAEKEATARAEAEAAQKAREEQPEELIMRGLKLLSERISQDVLAKVIEYLHQNKFMVSLPTAELSAEAPATAQEVSAVRRPKFLIVGCTPNQRDNIRNLYSPFFDLVFTTKDDQHRKNNGRFDKIFFWTKYSGHSTEDLYKKEPGFTRFKSLHDLDMKFKAFYTESQVMSL